MWIVIRNNVFTVRVLKILATVFNQYLETGVGGKHYPNTVSLPKNTIRTLSCGSAILTEHYFWSWTVLKALAKHCERSAGHYLNNITGSEQTLQKQCLLCHCQNTVCCVQGTIWTLSYNLGY